MQENYSSTPVSATTSLSNSVKISATNKLSNHQNSDLPQKIFTVTGNRRNVKQWLNLRVPVSKPRSLELIGDHDYMSRSSEAFRRIIPKQPINFQPPETSQLSVTSAARKSTLRKGRVYQERLVLLQWRQNFVEIIFANTSRKNGLTPRVGYLHLILVITFLSFKLLIKVKKKFRVHIFIFYFLKN